MTLTQDQSTFIGFGLELIFYGIYIVLFLMAFMSLTWRRKTHSIHKFYLFFCCFLYSCCTIHVFIKFRYLFKDLMLSPSPDGVLEAGAPALRAADALVTLIDFFAELVLIYRLWAIWNRNYYIIIIPFIMSLAFVSCAMAAIGILVSTSDAAMEPRSLVPFGTAAFAIPLCFNFIVTGLIIGRIWFQWKQTHDTFRRHGVAITSQSYLKDAMAVMIESGMLYLLVQFVLTVLVAINHPASILVSDIATQVYGIAPTLIFVRAGMTKGHPATLPSSLGYDSSAARPLNSPRNKKILGSGSDLSVAEFKRGMDNSIINLPTNPNIKSHEDSRGLDLSVPEA